MDMGCVSVCQSVPEAAYGHGLCVVQPVHDVVDVVLEVLRLSVLQTLVGLLHVAHHREQLQTPPPTR